MIYFKLTKDNNDELIKANYTLDTSLINTAEKLDLKSSLYIIYRCNQHILLDLIFLLKISND